MTAGGARLPHPLDVLCLGMDWTLFLGWSGCPWLLHHQVVRAGGCAFELGHSVGSVLESPSPQCPHHVFGRGALEGSLGGGVKGGHCTRALTTCVSLLSPWEHS